MLGTRIPAYFAHEFHQRRPGTSRSTILRIPSSQRSTREGSSSESHPRGCKREGEASRTSSATAPLSCFCPLAFSFEGIARDESAGIPSLIDHRSRTRRSSCCGGLGVALDRPFRSKYRSGGALARWGCPITHSNYFPAPSINAPVTMLDGRGAGITVHCRSRRRILVINSWPRDNPIARDNSSRPRDVLLYCKNHIFLFPSERSSWLDDLMLRPWKGASPWPMRGSRQ